jgi:hypothetical protein
LLGELTTDEKLHLAGMEMQGACGYLTELQYSGPPGAPAGPFDRLIQEHSEYWYLYRRTMPQPDPHNGKMVRMPNCKRVGKLSGKVCGQTQTLRMTHMESCCKRSASKHTTLRNEVVRTVKVGGLDKRVDVIMDGPDGSEWASVGARAKEEAHYEKRCLEQGMLFKPFVVTSTWGGFGARCFNPAGAAGAKRDDDAVAGKKRRSRGGCRRCS